MKALMFYVAMIAIGVAYYIRAKKEYHRLINEKADRAIKSGSDPDVPSEDDPGAESPT